MSNVDTARNPTVGTRGLAQIVTLPPPGPGFIGDGSHGDSRDRRAGVCPERSVHHAGGRSRRSSAGTACRRSASACGFRNRDVRGRGRGTRPRRGAAASRRRPVDDRRQRRRPQRGPGTPGEGAHSAVVGDAAERVALGSRPGSSTSRARRRRSGREPGVEARVYSGASGAIYFSVAHVLAHDGGRRPTGPERRLRTGSAVVLQRISLSARGRDSGGRTATATPFGWSDRLAGVRRSINNGSSDRRSRRVARDACTPESDRMCRSSRTDRSWAKRVRTWSACRRRMRKGACPGSVSSVGSTAFYGQRIESTWARGLAPAALRLHRCRSRRSRFCAGGPLVRVRCARTRHRVGRR